MNPADLRRLYRAARTVDTVPARVDALQARHDHAAAVLLAAMTDGPLDLPGYRVTVTTGPAGYAPLVARRAMTDAAQLALWRALEDASR